MGIKKITNPDGTVRWEASFYTNGRYGKRIQRRFDKKIDAEKFFKDCDLQRDDCTKNDSKILEEVRLETEINYWLNAKGPTFTVGYFRSIGPALNVIRSYCGNMTLSKLTMGFIHNLRETLRKRGLSPATQNRYIEILVRICNFSFQEERISKNPLANYKSLREPKQEMSFWSDEEVEIFLNFADSKYPKGSDKRWVFVAYLFALETGVRAREMWGVQYRDLDLERFTVRVSRQNLGKDQYSETKGKNERVVPVSRVLKEELTLLMGANCEHHTTIFQSSSKGAIDHQNFVNRIFSKDVKEAKVKRIRFHDLRHTAITLLVKQNISPWLVQRIAGHADLKTTMRYVHIIGKDVELVGLTRSFAHLEDKATFKLISS